MEIGGDVIRSSSESGSSSRGGDKTTGSIGTRMLETIATAGETAGRMKQKGAMWTLLPRGYTPK